MNKVKFGIIGNMGPEADTKFQQEIIKASTEQGAIKDQDHVNLVVIKNPDIPDRSEAINNVGESPISEILNSIKSLEKNKVQFAVMPCNTAHYFREDLQIETDILLLDILKETTDHIKSEYPKSIVGLLATNGTCNSGIYDKYLEDANIEFYKPDDEEQELVHSAIYGEKTEKISDKGQEIRDNSGIKSGDYDQSFKKLEEAINSLTETQETNTIILGCTELSIIRKKLEGKFPSIKFIDPMEIMAKKVVTIYNKALDRLKETSKGSSLKKQKVSNVDIGDEDSVINYIVTKAKIDHKKNNKTGQ